MSSGVSSGAAALFIANPLIGAAVGAGTLLAQKMLNNPFDQLFSYEYSVTGSFDDPVVTRGNAPRQPRSPARRSADQETCMMQCPPLRVAAIQMTSGRRRCKPAGAERMTAAAVADGASVVLLPENFG
jgi:pyruvate/2-oxoglutarate/acetoin dehydrogenase E1 component